MTARKSASKLDLNNKQITNLGEPQNGTDAARKVDVDTAHDNAISRDNHTGTQLSTTISDFDAAVRANRLDQMAAPTNPVGLGGNRLSSVGEPVSASDAATRGYVDSKLSEQVTSRVFKGVARVSSDSPVNIASPGATIDGITMDANDLVLLAGQTTGSQNGFYVYHGAASAMTRADNWDSDEDAKLGSYWVVTEGTHADSFALMTNDAPFVIGTSVLTLVHISATEGATAPYETDLGDGSATSFTCDHNLGTKAVNVVVVRNASPYDEIDVAILRPTANRVVIEPDDVWSAGQFHVTISKARG
ncbi:hypothetical protein [Mycolicibacter arupensis]|jgi:hypothetical protein|uniref:Capsid decoration protein n=1 Tax=Mycolicibacter arupensis TaxID=342002 RepID=A0A0F5MXS9_9MYCO|nr:hypothetical protein [Mycolicibacter arupensis]KKB98832.1 hypothetical protein WR43_12545 [Mycolicibacter arupensis]MCV7277105.1 hypothetical protein [Mycolicibacter arupensis]OQZ93667.1 hypothetical protein BST15_17495 [Mycolicibacter arupensis]TXI54429.1 MAG: hypothetical protein E6Q54_14595 [Mycolicibacter arupensis]